MNHYYYNRAYLFSEWNGISDHTSYEGRFRPVSVFYCGCCWLQIPSMPIVAVLFPASYEGIHFKYMILQLHIHRTAHRKFTEIYNKTAYVVLSLRRAPSRPGGGACAWRRSPAAAIAAYIVSGLPFPNTTNKVILRYEAKENTTDRAQLNNSCGGKKVSAQKKAVALQDILLV